MGKVLAGVVTCGLVAAVVLIGAAPSGAQDPLWPGDAVQLDSELLPDPDALPGEPLTVRPIENCTMEGDGPGVLFWRWQIGIEYPGETIRGVHGDEGEVPIGEDGSWEVSFPASTFSTFAGENPFVFVAYCLPNGRAGHAEEVDACFPSGEVDEVALTGEEPPFDCLFRRSARPAARARVSMSLMAAPRWSAPSTGWFGPGGGAPGPCRRRTPSLGPRPR
jgi:hypothetical protein